MWSNSRMVELIDEHVPSERDRAILKRRFVDGLTFEQLAEEFNMSVRQVNRIVHTRGDPLLLKMT